MRSTSHVRFALLGVLAVLTGCGEDFASAPEAKAGAAGVDQAGGADGGSHTGGRTGTQESSGGSSGSGGAGSSGAAGQGGVGMAGQGAVSGGGEGGGTGGTGGTAPVLDPGAACARASECASSECVDGVCCESDCLDVCAQCNVPGSEGSCVAVPSDVACGERMCPADTDCRQYEAGNLEDNCDDIGVCLGAAPCSFVDLDLGTPCGTAGAPGTCDGAGQCVVDGRANLGEACSVDDDCGSRNCVADASGASICCSDACDGACEACGSDGYCDQAPAEDVRCVIDCSASTACTHYPADPVAGACTGFGQCQTEAAFCLADQVAAGESCGADVACDGDGNCIVDLHGLGEACLVGTDCASDYCAANASGSLICCAGACTGVCEACGADGQCDEVPTTDARCSAIDCPNSLPCTTYNADLPNGACSGFGECETQGVYCAPSYSNAGDSCGTNMVCDGDLDCCPTVTGLSRTCSAACPCGVAEGVCTADTDCTAGLVCVAASVATSKLGFADRTCMPAHCDNNAVDSAAGETSQDCGGECGCRATYEVVDIVFSGVTVEVNDMNDDGTAFAVTDMQNPATGIPCIMDGNGVLTPLESYGVEGNVQTISDNGTFLMGSLRCTDPPDCTDTNQTTVSWTVGDAAPEFYSYIPYAGPLSASGNGVAYSSGGVTTRYVFSTNNGAMTFDIGSLRGISDDGKVVFGELTGDSTQAALWDVPSDTVTTFLPPVVSDLTIIDDVSADGRVAVGHSQPTGMGAESLGAFIWRSGGTLEEIPPLNSNATALYPREMSADGTRLVGYTGPNTYKMAVLWDQTGGLRTVVDELIARGLEPPADLELSDADFLTPDGTVIVGVVGGNEHFWRVKLLD